MIPFRIAARGLAGLAVLHLVACEPGSGLPVLAAPPVSNGYLLSTGDQIRLITYGEQSLTGQFAVDDGGNVALPLLGPVPAGGLTTAALAAEISGDLRRRNLLSDPSVVVEVATYRPIFVVGEVQRPGQYPYIPHMTMLTAVALAGGFTPRAVANRAEVVRSRSSGSVEGQVSRGGDIEPGDVITILERNF